MKAFTFIFTRGLFLLGIVAMAISPVMARPGHGPRGFHRMPVVRSYHHLSLPAAAIFAVIGATSYMIVDGLYYRRAGDNYVYVESPPISDQGEESEGIKEGTVVDTLPTGATEVTVNNGAAFYVKDGTWYASLAEESGFVVVAPQF